MTIFTRRWCSAAPRAGRRRRPGAASYRERGGDNRRGLVDPRFAQEEDIAFKKLVADYQKASGNKIEDSIIPFAPLRQKEVSAITSGVVPDNDGACRPPFLPLNAWADKLVDVSDIVEPVKSQYTDAALHATYSYNNVTKSAHTTACR